MENTRKLKYEKVYASWQEGLYPYLERSDVLENSNTNARWVYLENYKLSSNVPITSTSSIVFFLIGLEELEFLVKGKEHSEEIGYPKAVEISKIKDFVRKELLDPKECWEWVYVGYEQETNKWCLEGLLKNNSSDYIWLKPTQKPLYTLRKKASFSKLEKAYGLTKSFLKRKCMNGKSLNLLSLGYYFILYTTATALYIDYLKAAILSLFFTSVVLIIFLSFFDYIFENLFRVETRVSVNICVGFILTLKIIFNDIVSYNKAVTITILIGVVLDCLVIILSHYIKRKIEHFNVLLNQE